MKKITILFTLLFYVSLSNAQCNLQASFTSYQSNDTVTFTSTSQNTNSNTSYYWSVNGSQSQVTNYGQYATYVSNGNSEWIYTCLTITDSSAFPLCVDTFCDSIFVQADSSNACNLQVNFDYNIVGDSVHFYSTSTGVPSPANYSWTINNNYSSGTTDIWAPLSDSIFNVCLTIWNNSWACSDTLCQTYDLTDSITADSCDFQVSIDYQIVGDSIQFYTTSTGTTTPTSFTWIINGVSGGNNPTSTVYNNPFSPYYNVGVGFWDATGNCTDSIYANIIVDTSSTNPCNLQVNFDYNIVGDSVHFYSTSTGVPSPANYSWTINNNYSSGTTDIWAPLSDSIFNVCLTIWNNSWTCSDTLCQTYDLTDSTTTSPCNLQISFDYNVVGDSINFYSTSTGLPNNPIYDWAVNSFWGGSDNITVPNNDSSYIVCLTIWNSNWTCSDTLCQTLIINDSTNSLKENSLDYNIYPNPISNEFTIVLTDNISYNLTIYNMIGEAVLFESNIVSQKNINVSYLPKGIYLVKVYDQSNQRSRLEKIVIE